MENIIQAYLLCKAQERFLIQINQYLGLDRLSRITFTGDYLDKVMWLNQS